MLTVIASGLAIEMVFAAVALVYNVMFSTSKVLSVTTGHVSTLGGVFGAAGRASHRLRLPHLRPGRHAHVGKMIRHGTPDEVRADPEVIRVYLGA